MTTGETTAVGDPAQLRQILRNLISNAINHGQPPVSIRIGPGEEHTHLKIIDNGPGIPDQHRETIFDAYQRLHTSQSQPSSIGLGLTVSRTLAQLMNGHLSYEYGAEGSTFKLTLPSR
ncbi:MAG TPA: ATP-binding protein [Acidimicrobiia bacterium]|jgi:signal transduction histidine kinase|nr:ATP-binding protein [Acidimicrobiia bacterium]